MEKLGIADLARRSYRELSGGQQQRVLLARALCATERLVLLDEPVSGLDPLVTAEMYKIIKEINRESGITVIMVSHDIHGIVDDATHILHMSRTPLFYGTAGDYINSPIGKAFLCGDHHGGQPGADGVGADELHVGGLQHGVGGLDVAHQTLGLNKTQCLHKNNLQINEIITDMISNLSLPCESFEITAACEAP